MKITFALSLLLFLSAALSAAEFHVSPKGNDKNPGSAAAPFATLRRAAAAAGPGDTVKIAPGLYREQFTFRKSGKKGAPITFAGTRGPKGEYLSIIEPTGITLSKWTPAPEVAPGVQMSPLDPAVMPWSPKRTRWFPLPIQGPSGTKRVSRGCLT